MHFQTCCPVGFSVATWDLLCGPQQAAVLCLELLLCWLGCSQGYSLTSLTPPSCCCTADFPSLRPALPKTHTQCHSQLSWSSTGVPLEQRELLCSDMGHCWALLTARHTCSPPTKILLCISTRQRWNPELEISI